MDKYKLKSYLPFIIFILGILILLLSTKFGYYSAMYQSNTKGIVLSGNALNIYIILSTSKYIFLGFVLSLLGGFVTLQNFNSRL